MKLCFYLLLTVLLFWGLNSRCQSLGCFYPSDTRIYSSVDFFGIWNAPINLNCSAGNATYALNLTKRPGTFKCTASGRTFLGGDEYYFNVLNCPLDEEIFSYVVVSVLLGVFFIKKQRSCMMM